VARARRRARDVRIDTPGVDALERSALVCLAVEAAGDEVAEAIVLPWPQLVEGCLVFHDRGPTRRLKLPVSAFAAARRFARR
jgi:hypothetical protein